MANLESKDLRKAGLKVTIPRLKILQILEANSEEHMSAEDVFRALLDSGEDIGLATVYRVLTQFETAGLVQRHNFEGGSAVFELDDGDLVVPEDLRVGQRRGRGGRPGVDAGLLELLEQRFALLDELVEGHVLMGVRLVGYISNPSRRFDEGRIVP